MGLFGFGKKKTNKEILAEGRAQFERGDLRAMFLTLHGLANKGEPEACYYIGHYWLDEKGDTRMAKKYLVTAAQSNVRDAGAIIAKEYGIRDYLPQDGAESAQPVTPEPPKPAPVRPESEPKPLTADEAYVKGCIAYTAKNYAETIEWWGKAEELGHLNAANSLAAMYSGGTGVAKSPAKALQHFLKAAEKGLDLAQFNVAGLYNKGADGVPQDSAKAVYWYRKAAEQGFAQAQYELGCMYADGQGTEKDLAEARRWLQKAAEQGMEISKQVLAKLDEMETKAAPTPAPQPKPAAAPVKTDDELCNEASRVYKEDAVAAVRILLPLAEKGMARAQDFIALLYYRGDGVDTDAKKAAEWYRKAAEQGFGSSCFNLALFYERGIGVTKDLSEAMHWAEQAKATGQERADNLIAEIRHNMEVEKNRRKVTAPSTPKPGDNLSPEERYKKGMAFFHAGKYDDAFPLLDRVCPCLGPLKNKYPDGQAALGWMYEQGRGVEQDDLDADWHYKIAAQNGNRDGMAGFVRLTSKENTPSLNDCQTALDYAKQLNMNEVSALEAKLPEAQYAKGKAAYDAEDYTKAFTLLEQAAVQGHSGAQFIYGLAYDDGKGTAVDKTKALYWYEKAAEQGEIAAQFNAGVMYDHGEGTAVNKEKALYWFEKAAEQGKANAQFNCGVMYSNGEGTAVNKEKALYWFEKAAEQGQCDAQFLCGSMYEYGKGTSVDKAKALVWYEKAAEQGQEEAQFRCGRMYKYGDGTAVDKSKALYWLEKAAHQANLSAMALLAGIYRDGDGTEVNKATAFALYETLARTGVKSAQRICGEMYYKGEGTPRDKAKAKMWFEKAAADGDKDAKEALREYF